MPALGRAIDTSSKEPAASGRDRLTSGPPGGLIVDLPQRVRS